MYKTIDLTVHHGVIDSLNMVLLGYEIVRQTETTVTFKIKE